MKDLELIYAIYRHGSFSKAAEELYIGQSSLSMAVQRIESEIGLPLFDRRQHPVRLTKAGEEYISYYQKVKPLQTDLAAKIQDIASLNSGSLVLGGTHYLLSYILPDVIVRFMQKYPGIELKIVEAQSSSFRDMLADCEIDLCLKCDVNDPKLHTLCHAFFDKLYLAVPREQAAALGLAETALTAEQVQENRECTYDHCFRVQELEQMTFLQLTPGNNLCLRSENIFAHLGVRPKKIIHLEQLVTSYNLAGSGLGCTLASSRLIAKLNHPNLVYFELPTPFMVRDFHFTIRKDAYISRSVRAFCELFAQMESERNAERAVRQR